MKLSRLIEFLAGTRPRTVATQIVSPSITKALQRIIKRFEADAEASYNQTAAYYRIDHVYRDIQCIKKWLTEWLPSNDGSNYSAKLPSLGDVILTITGSRLVPRDRLDQVLDAHFMHRWDDEEDVAAIEGHYSQHRDVTGHRGIVKTWHYISVPDSDQMIKARVETKVTVTTTVSADVAHRPVTHDPQIYIHDNGLPKGRPLCMEWEEWL